jgi:hypothetical protein
MVLAFAGVKADPAVAAEYRARVLARKTYRRELFGPSLRMVR